MKPTALITGGSSGIGLDFARLFARDGYRIILVAQNPDGLEEAAAELKQKYAADVLVFAKDLSKADSARELFDEIKSKDVHVDSLVNCAGFGDFGLFIETDWQRYAGMIQLNVASLMQMNWLFGREMAARKSGRILNVASVVAFSPFPSFNVYAATKAAVLSFSQALSEELEGTGVTVTTLCPGATRTNFEKTANMSESKAYKNRGVATSVSVATYGYQKMMKGRRMAIPGLKNKILVFCMRFLPRNQTPRLMRSFIRAK